VLPVMNVMFLLIPALLLAMEVASMAAVAISPPKHQVGTSDPVDPATAENLDLSVTILADGYRVTTGEQKPSEVPIMPLAKPGTPLSDYERYNYIGLEDLVHEIKRKHPHETVVRVTAENDIPAQVLISTLDALRGTDCKLAGVTADDSFPEACLFFRPVVEAGGGV
jgi:biopolymer transport protein ExbD